jgi:hypothetical protein
MSSQFPFPPSCAIGDLETNSWITIKTIKIEQIGQ